MAQGNTLLAGLNPHPNRGPKGTPPSSREKGVLTWRDKFPQGDTCHGNKPLSRLDGGVPGSGPRWG